MEKIMNKHLQKEKLKDLSDLLAQLDESEVALFYSWFNYKKIEDNMTAQDLEECIEIAQKLLDMRWEDLI